jgi:hypothetical protein
MSDTENRGDQRLTCCDAGADNVRRDDAETAPRFWGALPDWLTKLLPSVPALLGIGGALAYAALSVASTVFYRSLGVTPSEVGLGYGELLARVAVIGAVVTFTALVAVVAVGLSIRAAAWGASEHKLDDRRTRLTVLAAGLVAVVLFVGVLAALPPMELQPSRADVLALVTFGMLVVVCVLVGIVVLDEQLADKCSITPHRVLVLAGVWLVLAPLSFLAHAREGTSEVQDGHVQRASLFGSPFPWQVTVASVTWKEPPPGFPRTMPCVLYLGSAQNAAVLYDPAPEARRSIRVPLADVIVQFHPGHTSCPIRAQTASR